jgi:hypothetical protein
MAIPVDEALEITQARCTSCLDCLVKCPEQDKGALHLRLPIISASSRGLRPRSAQALLVVIMLCIMTAAVSGAYLFPLPSFVWERGLMPVETALLELRVDGLNCRGNASLLTYFLDRDDELAIPGYIKLEAWPEPGTADARIFYDSGKTEESMIKMAITEAYYDFDTGKWRPSPFKIEGYHPLGQ